MAKGDVTIKFSAEDAAFVQTQLKVRDSIEKTGDASRKMAADVAKSGAALDKQAQGSGGVVSSLTAMASGYLSVGAAAAAALKVVQELNALDEKRAKKHNESGNNLKDALGNVGRTGDFTQLNNVAGAMKTTAFDQQGITKIIAEAVTRTKGEFNVNEVSKAAVAAVHAVEAGVAPDKAGAWAATRLQVEKLDKQGGFGKLSEEDKANMTQDLMKRGDDGLTDKDMELMGRATDKKKAYAVLTALKVSGERDKGGEKLLGMANYVPSAEEQLKWNRNPSERTLSEEEVSKKHIYQSGKTGEERLDAMLKNPKLVSQADRPMVGNVARAYHADALDEVLRVKPLNAMGKETGKMIENDPHFAAIVADRQEDVRGGQIDESGGLPASQGQTRVKRSMNTFRDKFGTIPIVDSIQENVSKLEYGPVGRGGEGRYWNGAC